jgi:hypothetical protein
MKRRSSTLSRSGCHVCTLSAAIMLIVAFHSSGISLLEQRQSVDQKE